MGGLTFCLVPIAWKAIAKIIRPMEEFVEQAHGSSKVEMSGRKFPVFHKSQLELKSA